MTIQDGALVCRSGAEGIVFAAQSLLAAANDFRNSW